MVTPHHRYAEPIGVALARQRLEHRARRLEAARAALRRRAAEHERHGYRMSPSLRFALDEFSMALDDVRREMDRLGHGRGRFARPVANHGT